jgi:hypothetical protein
MTRRHRLQVAGLVVAAVTWVGVGVTVLPLLWFGSITGAALMVGGASLTLLPTSGLPGFIPQPFRRWRGAAMIFMGAGLTLLSVLVPHPGATNVQHHDLPLHLAPALMAVGIAIQVVTGAVAQRRSYRLQ